MNGSGRKKILVLAGSTYILIFGCSLGLISLALGIILFNYRAGEPESLARPDVRQRPAVVTFDESTATIVTEGAQPAGDTSAKLNDTGADSEESGHNTPVEVSATPTAASVVQTNTVASATAMPSPSSISGRMLLDGVPAGGVTLKLEDQALNTIAQTATGDDGTYNFLDLAATSEGYSLVFAQEWNSQYRLDQVISWGWLGPIVVADGTVAQMPDFDISLMGFEPDTPVPNASFSAASVSSSNPVEFEWLAYPEATQYWVDLASGQDQNIVWQSPVAQKTWITFDGRLSSGTQIQPGEYWWGVGARRDLGAYKLTVYGYLPALVIVP